MLKSDRGSGMPLPLSMAKVQLKVLAAKLDK